MSSERGRLIVISGPTASGKSTLWRRLLERPGREFSVSATTRPPRSGEVDGCDYRFVSDADFDRFVEEGALLEWAHVHGCRYGTLRAPVEEALERGLDVVLEIDVQGAEQLRDCGLPQTSFFVEPPSREELIERLRRRATESEEKMRARLRVVDDEMSHADRYDHRIVNDDVDRMVAEVESILAATASEGTHP